ncbi:MAG: hypothetical protein HXS54_09435, partial [Theionarchaea archaeon]|nr:hypothetical protein [Theionarchaea archaeon]
RDFTDLEALPAVALTFFNDVAFTTQVLPTFDTLSYRSPFRMIVAIHSTDDW